jgi:hypothetical protein
MCGLAAALALAPSFDRVLLLEADTPQDCWQGSAADVAQASVQHSSSWPMTQSCAHLLLLYKVLSQCGWLVLGTAPKIFATPMCMHASPSIMFTSLLLSYPCSPPLSPPPKHPAGPRAAATATPSPAGCLLDVEPMHLPCQSAHMRPEAPTLLLTSIPQAPGQPGVGQYRFMHAMLARGAQELEALCPGYLQQLQVRHSSNSSSSCICRRAKKPASVVVPHQSKWILL